MLLAVPKTKTKLYGNRLFAARAPRLNDNSKNNFIIAIARNSLIYDLTRFSNWLSEDYLMILLFTIDIKRV